MAPARWTTQEVAEYLGVGSRYARQVMEQYGVTPVGRDVATGALLWNVAHVKAAQARRPGRGYRSDLERKDG